MLLVIVVGGNQTANILITPLPNSSTPATGHQTILCLTNDTSQLVEVEPIGCSNTTVATGPDFFANEVIYRFEEELVVPFKRVFGSEAVRIDFV